MRTKKENKFVSKLETSCTLPHELDFLPKRRIIALTNDPEVVEKCIQSGAVAAGGADILGRLETGGFHWDEYDDIVAHPDFVDSINKVRKILQNRMPSVKNGELFSQLLQIRCINVIGYFKFVLTYSARILMILYTYLPPMSSFMHTLFFKHFTFDKYDKVAIIYLF
ncbi:unnamed protein product, partial [Rodentolepis nana]|uniref:50S ribosomal protein L1 n=1 Tax=Rodentolepis nana TaxID=102285 RepID=A0A0R3TJ07_RODNA